MGTYEDVSAKVFFADPDYGDVFWEQKFSITVNQCTIQNVVFNTGPSLGPYTYKIKVDETPLTVPKADYTFVPNCEYPHYYILHSVTPDSPGEIWQVDRTTGSLVVSTDDY